MSQEKDRPSMHISQPVNAKAMKRFFKVWETEEEIEEIVLRQRWKMFWWHDVDKSGKNFRDT